MLGLIATTVGAFDGGLLGVEALGFKVTTAAVVIGLVQGLAYAAMAAGLILIYRATGVINFAHGEVGAFSAAILAKLVIDENWNFFLAFVMVLAVGGLMGATIELLVIRRLFNSPRIVLLVATIGLSQLLFFATAQIPGVGSPTPFPSAFDLNVDLGSTIVQGDDFAILIFVPLALLALALFLGKTPFGMAIRAAAENPDAARLAGVNVKRVSTVVWIIGGVLAAATVVLINPVRGNIVGLPALALGPGLLMRALGAALVGRMVSMPLTLVGGLMIGLIEGIANVNNPDSPGNVDGILFVVLLILVFTRGRSAVGGHDGGAWSIGGASAGVPERLRELRWVRNLPRIAAGLALTVAIALPWIITSPSRHFLYARVLIYAIAGLSVIVITSWAGHLSLCQFAFVGVGAFVTAGLHGRGVPFALAASYATVAGVFAAGIVGAPALRVKGLFLGITTLGFAVAARGWLFELDMFLGGDLDAFVGRGEVGPFDLSDQRTYYYLCLIILTIATVLVAKLRQTGAGRTIIAVRENEQSAASFTVSPTVVKLSAFALSGGLAALSGALLAGLRVQFRAPDFGPDESLRLIAMTIIGGLGSVWGAILGAVYVLGLPALINDSIEVRLLTSGVGLLFVLLYLPGGLLQVVYSGRDALLRRAERQLDARGVTDQKSAPATQRTVSMLSSAAHTNGDAAFDGPVLETAELYVAFGGLVAVDRVSLHANQGEVVGLIGTNGAGKSTLMNAVGGFVPVSGGQITVFGHDITHAPPHERARLGIGRVFQDARLFGDLTVREAISVALEAREASEFVPSMLRLPPARRNERRKASQSSELMDFVGLGRYADSRIGTLSTGTRRIVELACLIGVDARLIMLDEPTAGVAQRETEVFGPLIKRIQQELGATMVVIEHDMPMVMAMSDRIYCMSSGAVIAEGHPDEVRNNPLVISAYLGTDDRAIDRSDSLKGAAGGGDG